MLLTLIERRFGPVTPETRQRVHDADILRLERWADRILTEKSLGELLGT